MNLDQNSGEVITLSEAQNLVRDFQTVHPQEIKAFYVGSNLLKAIMEQEGCIGLRIYNAYDDQSKTKTVVLVGVDEDENDMKEGVIVDKTFRCPPTCPTVSILD
ncbi:MAG: hypothetical protein Q8K02_04660 [Flavobacterium sp.]|nr:hypothetical protein [Flavobacterium sp.]